MDFQDGHLGISLRNESPPAPVDREPGQGTAESEVIRGIFLLAETDYDSVNTYNLPDHIQGREGRDWIYAWDDGPQTIVDGVVINSAPDTDIVEGGPGKDFIHGGAGDDALYATDMSDAPAVVAGYGSLDVGVSGAQAGDFVSGQSGQDTLYGSGRTDGLFGGDGDDLIHGGGGDDVIGGDWQAVVSPVVLDPTTYDFNWFSFDHEGNRHLNLFGYVTGIGRDRVHAGAGDDLVWGGAADDVIYGDDGNDELNGDISGTNADGNANLPGEYHGNDYLAGGSGHDTLNGNGGRDTLFGGAGDDVLDGDFRVLIGDDAAYHDNDYLDGGAGSDTLSGSGGADLLLGADGDDALFGDLDGLDAARHGADVLFGGGGRDQLVGQGGDDVLHGGEDDDILYGDDQDVGELAGNDSLFGGRGADELSGGRGDDLLAGGEAGDSLWGDAGDDSLSGGLGVDYLDGGPGADTYLFAAGDSPVIDGRLEVIVDTRGVGNRIEFSSDVEPASLTVTLLGDSGDLILGYADADAVHIADGLTGAIGAFAFAAGSLTTFAELISRQVAGSRHLEGGAADDLVFGSGDDDALSGGSGRDVLHAGSGDDTLLGGDAGDVLIGGAGDDRLDGGAGPDQFRFAAGHGHDTIDDVNGHDVVWFSDALYTDLAFAEVDTDLVITRDTGSVTIRNWRDGAVEQLRFADDSVIAIADAFEPVPDLGRVLTDADAVDGAVDGSAGNDSFAVSTDGLVLRGGGGNNTYYLSTDFPATVVEDTTGAATLVVDGDPAAQLYLNRDGDDLMLVLDGAAVARMRHGIAHPPARVITPAGVSLSGDALAARINSAPTAVAAVAPMTLQQDAALTWVLPADAFADANDASLDISVRQADGSGLPDWLSFDPATRTLTGMPGNEAVGELALTVVASDKGGLSAESVLAISVTDVNDAPQLMTPPGERFAVSGYHFGLSLANRIFADPDAGDTLTFAATQADGRELPVWLALDPGTGILSGLPGDEDLGQLDLVLSATDAVGAGVSTTLSLTVERAGEKTVARKTQLAPVGELRLYNVTSMGDVDGDGYEDVLVRSRTSDGDGEGDLPSAGIRYATYLYYGQEGGWGSAEGRVTTLNDYGTDTSPNAWPYALIDNFLDPSADIYERIVVRALGDLDGDGYADLGINQVVGDEHRFDIYFGGADGLGTVPGEIPTDRVTRILLGQGPVEDWDKHLVALDVLDWNGDGNTDLLFGVADDALRYPTHGLGVYLNAGQWKGQSLTLEGFAGTADFYLQNTDPNGQLRAVGAAGDVNGDGFSDLYAHASHYVSQPYSASAGRQLIYGHGGHTGDIDLFQLAPSAASEIDVPQTGIFDSVVPRTLGDVNGDGIDDILFRSDRGAWVVFGRSDMPATLDLATLDGRGGFSIQGIPEVYQYTLNGFDVGSGDINGDGINDIAIGSYAVSEETYYHPDYGYDLPYGSGAAHVIFGRDTGFPAVIDVSALDGGQGFSVATPYPAEPAPVRQGFPLNGMVQLAVADIDGDGIQDILKTAVDATTDGGELSSSLHTLYGRVFDPDAEFAGSEFDDFLDIDGAGVFFTRGGDDVVRILPGAGAVSLHSGAGDDTIDIAPTADGSPPAGLR